MSKFLGLDMPTGFFRMQVVFGVWEGMTMPAGAQVIAGVAPIGHPSSVLGFREFTGTTIWHVLPEDVDSMNVASDGWTFIGFGPAGAASAGLAAAVDRHLAPWDIHVAGPRGEFQLHGWGGVTTPLPGKATWARVQERMARQRTATAGDPDSRAANAAVAVADPTEAAPDGLEMVKTFVDAALALVPQMQTAERRRYLHSVDAMQLQGIDRVEADISVRHRLGVQELTVQQSVVLQLILSVFITGTTKTGPPGDIRAAEDWQRIVMHQYANSYPELVPVFSRAASAAFLDYVPDLVAMSTVHVITRAIAAGS